MLLSVISAPLHMLVILNFCGFLLFLFAKSVQAFFLGPLRETEVKVTDDYCCCLSFCFVPITELLSLLIAENARASAELHRLQDYVHRGHAGAPPWPTAGVGRLVQVSFRPLCVRF